MEQIKKLSPHLIVILLFVGISFAYFSPVMQGKVLDMPDIKHWKGMSKEVQDFREAYRRRSTLDQLYVLRNASLSDFYKVKC